MDYTMHMPNSNHAVSSHFNFTTSPTSAGRKRTRSNSLNRSENVQKTARLLSPPRFRVIPSQSFPNPQLSCWSENRLNRTSSIGDLSNRTQALIVQDITHVDLMDCDNMPIDSDNDEIIQHHETDTSSSPSTRGQRQHRLHQLPFTMGRRSDCEKCRLRIPGHFNHVISH
ncbi:hypothetical protein RclHR1_02070007 [Rhizophagus clarus]|uniref:Uncharacterized protein n=1 Tax=Rhizophagus clarus TaxID=94130 RepID=A0A2Z6R503_9GLOM|nr:hypothetical protein RclHR1_02070007 [Rhizophagus clarus]GES82648.1 hypothetical protein GLOIN_2v1529638 [Rhizophagus clarus]